MLHLRAAEPVALHHTGGVRAQAVAALKEHSRSPDLDLVNAPLPTSLLAAIPAQAPARSDTGMDAPVDRRRAQRAARAARAAARAAVRAVVPHRSAEFGHLTLPALRTYRKALLEEADKVSYWRRILQARLDTVRDGVRASRGELRSLAPVLSHPTVQRGRSALVTIVPSDDVPPLPDLARLWEMTPDPSDPRDAEAVLELTEGLVAAEAELSSYRAVLHRRLDAATMELIARYREEPTLCLAALPLDLPASS